jgi:hypothetical protein
VANVERLGKPVELRLEFGAIVGLQDVNAERQATDDSVEELHRRPLIAGIVYLRWNPASTPRFG